MLIEKHIFKQNEKIIIPYDVNVQLIILQHENASYNWYIKYDDISSIVKLEEKTNSLTIPLFHKEKTFQYICEVCIGTNIERYIIDVAIVKIFAENTQEKQQYTLGEKVTLQLDINDNIENDISVCWQKYNNEAKTWDAISDEKTLEIIPEKPAYESKQYRAIVKYDNFEFASKTYEICWNQIIKKQPISKGILFVGELLQLSVEVVNNIEDKITYNWQYKEGDSDWQSIEYASKKSYTVRSELLEHVITYIRCELKYGDKLIYTEPCEIIYLKRGKHSFAIEPVEDVVNAKIGSCAALEIITKSDMPVKYRWEKMVNGNYIELSSKYDKSTLSFKEVRMADAGIYRCIALGEDETITSEDIELKVTSDFQTIDAKALIVVDRSNDKLINGKDIYHKVAFKGLMHFENIREAITHPDLLVKISSEIEKYSSSVINNTNLKENDSISIKDLVYLDVFLHKNDAVHIIEETFNDENRKHKLVDLFGINKPITNVSLLNLANIVNEFIKIPRVHEILMKKSCIIDVKEINRIFNRDLYQFGFGDYNIDMYFRTFECNSEIFSIAICKLVGGREYLVFLVDENEKKCFDETVKLVKYVLN